MNLVTLAGRLGCKPELRYTNNKKIAVTTLRVATKDQKGTTWHNVTVWSDQAELCCKFLEQGSKVVIVGRIEYKNSLIHEVNITLPEVIANHVEFL